MRALNNLFDSYVDALPVVFARAVVGLACVVRAFEGWRFGSRVLAPDTLKAHILPGLTVPPEVLWLLIPAWAVSAILFSLGLALRVSGSVLTLCLFSMLLMDEQLYSNHLYLLSLEVLLLTLAGGPPPWRAKAATVPAWPVWLLKYQLSVVYLFAAVTKIVPTYLSGAVLFLTLKKEGFFAFPQPLRTLPVLSILAAASIMVEIFLALALWSPKYRKVGAITGALFHTALTLLIISDATLQLVVFSLAVLAIYPLYFYPAAQLGHRPRS